MRSPPPEASIRKSRWLRYVEHKEAAETVAQRSSFFFGIDRKSETRIDVPRSALERGHCHVQGRPGSGKTAATLLSIAIQAIRGYRDESGKWARKSPVVVFDLKGDQSLFHAVRLAAEEDGRQFRFFSTRKGHGYHFFDPFQVVRLRNLEPVQIAAAFVRALSLDYGLAYGGLFFTDNNVVLLMEALTELQRDGSEPTLERLSDVLERLGRRANKSDAQHIVLCFRKLAAYPQINVTLHSRPPTTRIDYLRALEQGEVIYIYMEMDTEATILRHIAGLQLDALVSSARSMKATGKQVPFTVVIADEFYHIAGHSFGDLLSMSREWGLHFFLSNQDPAQLEAHDKSIPAVVTANTSVSQVYTLDSPDARDQLQRMSGEKTEYRHSRSVNSFGIESTSYSEAKTWHLSDDTINEITDTRQASLLYFDKGEPWPSGERVKEVQGLYPIFQWQHEEYRNRPLPSVPEYDLKSDEPEGRATTAAARRDTPRPEAPARNSALQERMAKLWDAVEAEGGAE